MTYHKPVLLKESIEGLSIKSNGVYVDATFGGGGHSKSILKHLNTKGYLYGFDQDKDAEANALRSENFTFVPSNFRYLKRYMTYYDVSGVDGILADLGISSHQIDTADRGFSFRKSATLDMRMNQKMSFTAAEILNDYGEARLQEILGGYGEVRNARTLSKAIVQAREKQKFRTIDHLNELLERLWKGNKSKYYAQVYQALRIEVNDEMGALKDFLKVSKEVLNKNGRLVVITYHSIEDRIVKNFMKYGNSDGGQIKDDFGNIERPFELINKKVIIPHNEEIKSNPRARSAKLRIAQKK